MTFDDMWKSLEERDTTGKYKQAREMAELNMEQLEFAYNSGYAEAKSKYEKPKGKWIITAEDNNGVHRICCPFCNYEAGSNNNDVIIVTYETLPNYCESCGADMRDKKRGKKNG